MSHPVTSAKSHASGSIDPRVMATTGHGLVIAATAFLTLIDLFAVQSVLPTLAKRYGVNAAEIAVAANACTFGMALASLGTAMWGQSINRRIGIAASLILLALPTTGLAFAPEIGLFAVFRVLQGMLMATAFTLMLAHLSEHFCPISRPVAFSAFITGNVLSNLVGRILAANVVELYGVPITFFAFAALNLLGGILVIISIPGGSETEQGASETERAAPRPLRDHLANPKLRAAFMIGFLILFAFIGVFSFVNFVLASPLFGLSPKEIGWMYLVFVPALPVTLLMGRLIQRAGPRLAIRIMLALALIGLPLLATGNLIAVLAGLTLVAAGTFAAQAGATGYVGSNATHTKSAASGLYLAAYFAGGLLGSSVLGLVFEQAGWIACLLAIGLSILCSLALTRHLQ